MRLMFGFMPLFPFVVVLVAMFALSRMAKRRWIVHVDVFVILLAYPAWLITASAFDSTLKDANIALIQFALGLLLLPYLPAAVLMMVGYCIFAWGKSRTAPAVSST